jgi:GntR family transcriptional regulator/MocR family aminotransferase
MDRASSERVDWSGSPGVAGARREARADGEAGRRPGAAGARREAPAADRQPGAASPRGAPAHRPGSRDLHLELAPRGERRAALERAVRAAIRDGRLAAGDRLPSTRALAADLGLARGTVTEAYAQLTAEGYLTARPGAPTRVAFAGAAEVPAGPVQTRDVPRLDLTPGTPDVGAFPRGPWLRALRRSFAAAPDSVLGYRDLRGRPELRSALAAYLGRARGVRADPDRIVVCAGFNEGFGLLLAALPGGTLAMEDPCLHFHRRIAHAAGRTIVPMAVDERGAAPPLDADAALLTPAHQFPLGATLAPERRAAFVRWARERQTVVIEDDYDGEFRFDRQPAGALQGLDPERVVYAGTASKTLAPGLRLAWLVLPAALVEPVLEAKLRIGGTTVLEQLALAELIASGGLDRHVRRMRARYRRRRDALLDLLGDRRTRGIAAGLHLVVDVEDEAAALEAGTLEGVALQGLEPFWHDTGPQGLVIGYAAPPQHAYAASLDALGRALARASTGTT